MALAVSRFAASSNVARLNVRRSRGSNRAIRIENHRAHSYPERPKPGGYSSPPPTGPTIDGRGRSARKNGARKFAYVTKWVTSKGSRRSRLRARAYDLTRNT